MCNDDCDPPLLHRSFPLLFAEGVACMRTKKIAIAGCGGVGGSVASTLARMGVTRFQLSDLANFDLPDMNRQWGASHKTLGRHKVEVYRDMIKDIQPDAEISLFP